MTNRRIYLDNAATSHPRPECVAQAVAQAAMHAGSPGRGAYAEARAADAIVRRCRERICTLINGADPDHVVFTLNATDSINLAIRGVVAHRRRTRPGEPVRIVTTAMDHNAVSRPLISLANDASSGVELVVVPADACTGVVDPKDLCAALTPETALVTLIEASNVTGAMMDLPALCATCCDGGVPTLIDAAQSIGHIPFDAKALGVDMVCFPGHKGMLGPLGTGVLYVRPEMVDRLDTMRAGGTGESSHLPTQPQFMPHKLETGSPNLPGIAGLDAAAGWLLERGIDAVRAHELELMQLFLDRTGDPDALPGLRLIGPTDPAQRIAVFSFVHETLDPQEMATILEAEFGVLARPGLHCAPAAHTTIGTIESGGTLRLSPGALTTREEVELALEALDQVCRSAVGV